MKSLVLVVCCMFALPLVADSPRGWSQPLGKPDPQKPAQPILDGDGRPLPAGALTRLGSFQFRHKEMIRFLGFAGDRQQILAASTDGEARLWDLTKGKEVWRLAAPANRPDRQGVSSFHLVVARNGNRIGIQVDDLITVLDPGTGKELRRFPFEQLAKEALFREKARLCSLSADGQWLVIAENRNNNVGTRFGVWNTVTGVFIRALELGPKDRLLDIALSDDGTRLVTNEFEDQQWVRLWDVKQGKQLRILAENTGLITNLQFTPDGKSLVGLVKDSYIVQFLDSATGKELRQFPAKERLYQVMMSADGQRLFGVGRKQVHLWDVTTGQAIRQFPTVPTNRELGVAALAPDGKTLAITSGTGIRRWEVESGKELGTRGVHGDFVGSVAFSPSGKQVVTTAPNDPVRLWEVKSGRLVREFPSPLSVDNAWPDFGFPGIQGKPFQVRVAFSANGQTVAGLSFGRSLGQPLQRWETATGKPMTWPMEARRLFSFAFSPDGKSLALTGEGLIRLVHPETGKLLRQLAWAKGKKDDKDQTELAGFTTFSRDGKTLFNAGLEANRTGLSVTVQAFEMLTGQQRVHFLNNGAPLRFGLGRDEVLAGLLDLAILGLAASSDGKYLASATYNTIHLWDLATRRQVRVFGGPNLLLATGVFSPDGQWLLAGRLDGGLRVWEVATGTLLHDLPGHGAAVTTLAFSLDGKMLASDSADTTVLIWDWAAVRRRVAAARANQREKPELLWQALAGADASKAAEALHLFIARPEPTLTFLKARLKPIVPADPGRVEKLLTDLDSKQFAARQAAITELEQLGDLASEAIHKRLSGKLPLEVQQRVEALRDKLDAPLKAGPLLQALRTIEVLEHIDTPEARKLLENLATGATGHRLTVEAMESLRRLKKTAP